MWMLTLGALLAQAVVNAACTDDGNFTNAVTLDAASEYTLRYRVDRESSRLVIGLRARTTGWMGFGLSESGHMMGSDIVTAAVVGGQPRVEDRFADWDAYPFDGVLPTQDKCNNWDVICSSESDGYSEFIMQRPLDTKDSQDRVVANKDMYVIFAWGTSDTISYHGTRRGTTVVNFFNPVSNFTAPADADGFIDVKINNYVLSEDNSQYVLQKFDVGTATKHVVAVQTMFNDQDLPLVHHLLLHDCGLAENAAPLLFLPLNSPVNSGNLSPLGLGACQGLLAGWAKGGQPIRLPDVAGYKIGSDSARYVVLEIHLNNPSGLSGQVITSGLRLYTASTLRQYDVGTLVLGDAQIRFPSIPAGTSQAHYESTCPSDCLSTFAGPITIFNSFPHMHSYGREIASIKYDKDGNSTVISSKQYWNYEFQDQTSNLSIQITGTDRISTHCVFDTSEASQNINFGPSTTDEMCLDFVAFYPKENGGFQCGYRSPTTTLCKNGLTLNIANPEPDGLTGIPPNLAVGQEPVTCPIPDDGNQQDSTLSPTVLANTPSSSPVTESPFVSSEPSSSPTTSPAVTQQPSTGPPISLATIAPSRSGAHHFEICSALCAAIIAVVGMLM